MASSRVPSGSAQVVYDTDDYISNLLFTSDKYGVKTHTVYGSSFVLPVEKTFQSIESIQRYIDDLWSRPEVRRIADHADLPSRVRVRSSGYYDQSNHRQGVISIGSSDSFFRELTALHELAHLLGGNGHGARYRSAYLKLIETVISPELAFIYRVNMDRIENERNQ